MKNIATTGLLMLALAASACASFNDAMTPSVVVIKDDFDGTLIVRQPSVNSSSSLREDLHTLGFEWMQRTPDTVFITVGVFGVQNITDVAFNADGRVISDIKPASVITEYGTWSERRFAMPLNDFLAIANAKVVKMRVTRINDYSVSSFGTAVPGAIVSSKFPPFLEKIKQLRKS